MLTLEVLLAVLVLALLDSVNPSALLVTMHLLPKSRATSRVLSYLAGVFTAYFLAGVALVLGIDALVEFATDVGEHPIAYGLQGLVGALMLGWSIFTPSAAAAPGQARVPRIDRARGYFLLGVTVTGIELSTALPYVAAIGLLATAGVPFEQSVPVLFAYNLVFVLPPLLLLLTYRVGKERLGERYDALQGRLQRQARTTYVWVVGIVGFVLLVDSLAFFSVI